VVQALLERVKPSDTGEWLKQIRGWKAQHPIGMNKPGLTPEKIIKAINRTFDSTVITTDVGQNQLWATQFLELDERKRMLTSGGMGTMGYGLPAAIGAKIGNPGKDVVVIAGDGGMQMNIQEMATAVCYELPIIICILNNGYLGNVRQWQELFFDRRYSWTCMRWRRGCAQACNSPTGACPPYTPDFIRLAESYGAKGIRVTGEEEIGTALETARHTEKVPTVIEFIIEREANVWPIVPPGKELADMLLAEDMC
ncbi:MAG: acetolactate synthase large subunit, partial [Lachnospiraceae bacterium]|nr:acetolactate synthase large subunit [Lachnospiraceae bacterium]